MPPSERPSTPPPQTKTAPGTLPRAPLTPEQIRKIEINRMKAKALREQLDAQKTLSRASSSALDAKPSPNQLAGTKRSYTSTQDTPATIRDASAASGTTATGASVARPLDEIRPARNFTRYVEYDFSKMTDAKGGFLSAEDDPHNRALHAGGPGGDEDAKPPGMTLKEWERQRLLKSLRDAKQGPFEPGISGLDRTTQAKCQECGTLEVDFKWLEELRCAVCNACKDKLPERYSLLTKTEAREDYLLTDPELKDAELLPHIERPNPHHATWNNMMLYLRYQIEEYAFSKDKWGSPEALDAEFERREAEKKKRKEKQFRTRLNDLKKRTRVDAYRRANREGGAAGAGGNFGDDLGGGKHVHEWGRSVEDPETGMGTKRCIGCGMEVEELEF